MKKHQESGGEAYLREYSDVERYWAPKTVEPYLGNYIFQRMVLCAPTAIISSCIADLGPLQATLRNDASRPPSMCVCMCVCAEGGITFDLAA